MMAPDGVGRLLRSLREFAGRTRVEQVEVIQARSGLWVSEDKLKRWETEKRLPERAAWPRLAEAYGVPAEELERAVAASKRCKRAAVATALLQQQGDVDEVDRRNFLGVALAAGTLTEPWERLAAALSGTRVDAATAEHLTASTAAGFSAEEHLPARVLAARLSAHLDAITTVLPHAGAHRQALTIAAGETAALVGWLAYDMGDTQGARHFYDTALLAGQKSGHPAVTALTLGYASYGAPSPAAARRMLADAQKHVRGPGYATARAWLAAREAEEAAAEGERETALRAIDRAHTAFDYARPVEEQAWVGFFRRPRLGSLTVSTYAQLRHPDLGAVADETLTELGGDDTKVRVVILGDVAAGYLTAGDVDRAVEVGRRALDATLQSEASMGAQRLVPFAEQLPGSAAARVLAADIRAAFAPA